MIKTHGRNVLVGVMVAVTLLVLLWSGTAQSAPYRPGPLEARANSVLGMAIGGLVLDTTGGDTLRITCHRRRGQRSVSFDCTARSHIFVYPGERPRRDVCMRYRAGVVAYGRSWTDTRLGFRTRWSSHPLRSLLGRVIVWGHFCRRGER